MSDNTAEVQRKRLVDEAVIEANKNQNAERIILRWRDSDYPAIVVTLPVDRVVLNPLSHRIRAQLESLPNRALFNTAPFSTEAQSAIEAALRGSEYYKELKQNLDDIGQLEPGIVTATGLLVNANTRCVALRDLGKRYIRAAVLPADADQREIDRLELSLQMKRDFRSEYTFTNELLFVADLIRKHNYTPANVAIEMGWASEAEKRSLQKAIETVGQHMRILSLIRELQHLSNDKLNLTAFDSRRQALTEIDTEIEKRKQSDQDDAEQVKLARLAAMLAEVGYRDLREIDEGFVANYLVPAMEEKPGLREHIDALTLPEPGKASPELSGLDVFAPLDEIRRDTGRSARSLLDMIAKSEGESEVVVHRSGAPYATLPRRQFIEDLKSAYEDAAEDVRFDREEGNALERPIDLVRKATKYIKAALEAFTEIQGRPEFDTDRFEAAKSDLETSHKSLKDGTPAPDTK